MSILLPFDQVKDRLLAAQSMLNSHQQEPITDSRALLLLSRPVCSVMLCDVEAIVMEFYGLFWVVEVDDRRTGFFASEVYAVRYLQGQMTEGG